MKRNFFFFALALFSVPILAQSVWNKKLPQVFPNNRPLSDVHIDNGRYLVTAGAQIFEFAQDGALSGYVDRWNQSTQVFHSLFIRRHANIQTGDAFFVTVTRSLLFNTPAAYRVNILIPGMGYENPLVLSDSLVSVHNGGPAIVEINDHTFWILGRKFIRQITVSPNATINLDWEKSLDLPAGHVFNTAILKNSQVYAGTNQGLLMAFDLNGNALWSKDYQNIYAFRGMQARADGFLACGSNNNAKGVLLAFDETGNLQWEIKPGDDGYNSLIENADGSIVATGIHISGRAALTKINAAGQLLWRRIYEAGHGGKLLPAIDGGYIFMAHSIGSPANAYVIKTNDLGETDEFDENIAVSGQRELSNGGFRLKQLPSSALFFDLDGGSFEIPADSMTYLFFSHSPWIGAVDDGGNLHLSAGQFGETSFPSDYQTGIINSPSRDFNRLWAITRAEIDALQRDFEEDGVLDNTPGYDVLTWPAKGNPYFSSNFDFTRTGTHPDSLPAPFVDRNGDGRYHVYDGDYPVLKGDRMLWWVMNDNQQHELSNGQPLRVDIMLTVFAYDCAENPLVQQSVFAEYQVINRSAESYHHSYFGFNTFAELGCGEDDYIGSMPDAQSFFVYNADGFDGQSGTGCFSGSPSFGAQIPIESVTFLDQSLNHLLYFSTHLPGGPGSSDPIVPSEYYNYLQGRWRDNVLLTYGGTGYNPDDPNAVPVNHVFPDNPADPQGWSMCSEQLPTSDRRLVSSNGPFVFGAGDTFTLRLAFSFHPDIPHPCPDVFGLVKPGILDIRQWHDDGTLDATLDLGSVQLLPPGQSIALDATLPHATAYEWSNGAITPSISVNTPGEYTVSVTRASGCVSTETVLVKSASGAQAPEETIEWSVQPNPARDLLNIVLPALPENASVRMFNAQGQTVMLRRLETTQMSLQVAHLPAGLYWVELFQDGWKGGSRKVVVTR